MHQKNISPHRARQKNCPKALKKTQLIDKKPPLCKGRWFAEGKTEGLVFSRIVPPSVSASTDSFPRRGKPDSSPFATFSAVSNHPIVFIVLLCCCLFLLPACSRQEVINDQETGEISAGQPSVLRDGTYILTARYYDHWGYRQKLEASVCDGLVTKVSLGEINVTGSQKLNTKDWPENETGQSLSEIYHLFARQIIEKQDAKTDTVSGATKTSSDFKTLAESFVDQAKTGQTGETSVCLGDTYTAERDFQSNIHSTLVMTFDNENKITDAAFSENVNGTDRSANMLYRQLYTDLCEKNIAANNLSSLEEDPNYPDEYSRYNALLIVIDQQRNGIE